MWTDLLQTRDGGHTGSACTNDECDSKNLEWSDGKSFAFGDNAFESVSLEAGEWCTALEAGTTNLKSVPCAAMLRVVCQIDCVNLDPGKILKDVISQFQLLNCMNLNFFTFIGVIIPLACHL